MENLKKRLKIFKKFKNRVRPLQILYQEKSIKVHKFRYHQRKRIFCALQKKETPKISNLIEIPNPQEYSPNQSNREYQNSPIIIQNQKNVQLGLGFQKIRFSIESLIQSLQLRYHNQQKLQNTLMILPNSKFMLFPPIPNPLQSSYIKMCKWESALIIYQISTKKQGNHFGLLLKYQSRFITFDGIKFYCPSFAQQSNHWQQQMDNWSCGYRVIFWYTKILEAGGLQKWIKHFECRDNS